MRKYFGWNVEFPVIRFESVFGYSEAVQHVNMVSRLPIRLTRVRIDQDEKINGSLSKLLHQIDSKIQ